MMVIFVSQCEKKALARTRKVLDAFANRIGDNTWQTVITEDGLLTVRQLLRQTASKNTAVSCHWVRSRSRSDLLWIVGNRRRFNLQGIVPVNRTRRNLLHSEWENHWQHIGGIQIVAVLAALLHDLGKSTVGFQHKLRQSAVLGDPYRHEWISLKILEWLLLDCSSDQQWLTRLADIQQYLTNPATALEQFLQKNQSAVNLSVFPPLAQWVAWLVVSHHRTVPFGRVYYNASEIKNLNGKYLKHPLSTLYKQMKAVEFWVHNPNSELSPAAQADYWRFEQLVLHSGEWQKQIKRWANKALQHQGLLQLSAEAAKEKKAIDDPLLLHFSRLCLMMADYHYSSLATEDKRRLHIKPHFAELAANTDRSTKTVKQSLDEHLLGVAQSAAKFARVLPVVADELPALKQQDSLIKNTTKANFTWQNKAFQSAKSVQTLSQEQGFFGVNMASTGCGKTIGNARIMYALADKDKGARFTVALGLRVLTLQTGQSYRDNLGLSAAQLAILVGGSVQRKLYEMLNQQEQEQEQEHEKTKITQELAENPLESAVWGSESAEEIVDGFVDSTIDYSQYDQLNLESVLDSQKAKELLFSPVAVCTVDHLIQATECKRGGKYIVPMLRLLSSDLILDEPDDFDQADLPALSRLVHLVGLLGGRILLSSATLPPDLIQGLFKAYFAGRSLYHQHHNKVAANVVCAWFDEREKAIKTAQCSSSAVFLQEHQAFIDKRVDFLRQQPVRRQAAILPLSLSYAHENPTAFYEQLAQQLAQAAVSLHQQHHNRHSDQAETVSVGLIRIANIKHIIQLASAFNRAVQVNADTHIHLCCYHAKQLLVLRNLLESRLDRTLKRDESQPDQIFEQAEIQQALRAYPAKHHLFIVLATPVAEVGRDHDYDWAIVEPSSMRSIVQLAGRIWRHRPNKVADSPNLLILQRNIRALQDPSAVAFTKPGFESKETKLATHDMCELIPTEQLQRIDAAVRIAKSESLCPERILADLEHQVIGELMNNKAVNVVNAYWDSGTTAHRAATHLQIISPFRAGRLEEEWLVIPEEDREEDKFAVYAADQVRKLGLAQSATHNYYIRHYRISFSNPQVSPWLNSDLNTALRQLQQQPDESLRYLASRYASVGLEEHQHGWCFNEWLGFWSES
ncbi:type I-F CRISPR-associated helicase Cas3f [Pasteurella testudinis]|uniref:type I-F CRISPR-associated helicase Cas3f n=1 Tax=Pasteurella testudinis TaxID=761 RepID=UPI004059EA23